MSCHDGKIIHFCSLNSFSSSLYFIQSTYPNHQQPAIFQPRRPASLSFPLSVAPAPSLPLSPLMFQSMNKWLLLFSLLALGQHVFLLPRNSLSFWEMKKNNKKRETCSSEGLEAHDRMSWQSGAEYIYIFKWWLAHQETSRHSLQFYFPNSQRTQTWQLHFISSFLPVRLCLFISALLFCLLQT